MTPARSGVIVKASYTRSAREAKASVRYMQHRSDNGGERQTRQLFGRDGELSRTEAYERLDAASEHANKTYFYRLTFNPGEGRGELSDESRSAWAHDLVSRLEQQGVVVRDWVAVSHTDQGEHDHVHVLAATSRTVQKDELADLRSFGREAYETRRGLEVERGLYLDDDAGRFVREIEQQRQTQRQVSREAEWDW